MHLLWAERNDAGVVEAEAEDDAILFPDEATFAQVRRCISMSGCPH